MIDFDQIPAELKPEKLMAKIRDYLVPLLDPYADPFSGAKFPVEVYWNSGGEGEYEADEEINKDSGNELEIAFDGEDWHFVIPDRFTKEWVMIGSMYFDRVGVHIKIQIELIAWMWLEKRAGKKPGLASIPEQLNENLLYDLIRAEAAKSNPHFQIGRVYAKDTSQYEDRLVLGEHIGKCASMVNGAWILERVDGADAYALISVLTDQQDRYYTITFFPLGYVPDYYGKAKA